LTSVRKTHFQAQPTNPKPLASIRAKIKPTNSFSQPSGIYGRVGPAGIVSPTTISAALERLTEVNKKDDPRIHANSRQ
jgi:hypothetical protein